MTIESSDPRLTAYAFGELTGEEKTRFEAELQGSLHAQRELAEIERTLDLLRQDVGRQAPPALDHTRRQAIEQAARAPRPALAKARRRWFMGVSSAVALAAGALLFVTTTARKEAPETTAAVDQRAASEVAPSPMAIPEPAAAASAAPRLDGVPFREPDPSVNRDKFDQLEDNPFIRVASDPRSTFSIDVDTASYSLLRRHLNEGRLPPRGAVRIEEMINYFSYSYPEPEAGRPFAVQTEVASAPWTSQNRLLRIGIKGKEVPPAEVPGTNLVFLIDTSGSMLDENKLPLLKRAFRMLVEQLDERDRISIVVYAGSSGLVLPPTPGNDRRTILGALERLEAGGSTNGGEGIRLAYQTAARHFVKGGINRVLLATDGDFNVGITDQSELVNLIEQKAKTGVFLSVLGFGGGNYNDSMLEKLADKGNGNYSYIDSVAEARKVLVEQATGTLITIAKDVKIQIEFNPRYVESFRLIGYENRVLAHQDFDDDDKDAGEIGAGHTVTALYEIVPVKTGSGELGTIKLRYKQPDGDKSELIQTAIRDTGVSFDQSTGDFRFAAAVAELGMLLRQSPHKGEASYQQVISLASDQATEERRREFITLAKAASQLGR